MAKTPDLSAFNGLVQGRDNNDSSNSDRETAIELLFSPDSEKRDILLKKSPHAVEWGRISSAFANSIKEFVSTGGPGVPPSVGELMYVIRLGGRSNNYDFEGHFKMLSGSLLKLKIELKRGDSIYDQPEFLSLYAKDGDLIGDEFPSYASWFYDNYLPSITMLADTLIPSKTDYLNNCFGTNYGVFSHTKILYELDVPGSSTKKRLQAVAFDSIDSYLNELEQKIDMVDLNSDWLGRRSQHS